MRISQAKAILMCKQILRKQRDRGCSGKDQRQAQSYLHESRSKQQKMFSLHNDKNMIRRLEADFLFSEGVGSCRCRCLFSCFPFSRASCICFSHLPRIFTSKETKPFRDLMLRRPKLAQSAPTRRSRLEKCSTGMPQIAF